MITRRRTEYAELFGLPADPEAIEKYEALAPAEQESLRLIVTAVAAAAQGLAAPLTLEWWVDAEDEAWQEFVIAVNPPGTPRERLDVLYRLSDPLERAANQLDPQQREWRRENLGMVLAH